MLPSSISDPSMIWIWNVPQNLCIAGLAPNVAVSRGGFCKMIRFTPVDAATGRFMAYWPLGGCRDFQEGARLEKAVAAGVSLIGTVCPWPVPSAAWSCPVSSLLGYDLCTMPDSSQYRNKGAKWPQTETYETMGQNESFLLLSCL